MISLSLRVTRVDRDAATLLAGSAADGLMGRFRPQSRSRPMAAHWRRIAGFRDYDIIVEDLRELPPHMSGDARRR